MEQEPRLYSTDLFVTVNPHRTYTRALHDDFARAIEDLSDPATAQRVLGQSSQHPTIYEARITPEEVGWELSTRARLFHAHFLLELTHSGGLRLGPVADPQGVGVQRRLQRYFSDALSLPGVYVNAILTTSSAAKNYMRKQQEARAEEGAQGRLLPERTLTGRAGAFRRAEKAQGE